MQSIHQIRMVGGSIAVGVMLVVLLIVALFWCPRDVACITVTGAVVGTLFILHHAILEKPLSIRKVSLRIAWKGLSLKAQDLVFSAKLSLGSAPVFSIVVGRIDFTIQKTGKSVEDEQSSFSKSRKLDSDLIENLLSRWIRGGRLLLGLVPPVHFETSHLTLLTHNDADQRLLNVDAKSLSFNKDTAGCRAKAGWIDVNDLVQGRHLEGRNLQINLLKTETTQSDSSNSSKLTLAYGDISVQSRISDSEQSVEDQDVGRCVAMDSSDGFVEFSAGRSHFLLATHSPFFRISYNDVRKQLNTSVTVSTIAASLAGDVLPASQGCILRCAVSLPAVHAAAALNSNTAELTINRWIGDVQYYVGRQQRKRGDNVQAVVNQPLQLARTSVSCARLCIAQPDMLTSPSRSASILQLIALQASLQSHTAMLTVQSVSSLLYMSDLLPMVPDVLALRPKGSTNRTASPRTKSAIIIPSISIGYASVHLAVETSDDVVRIPLNRSFDVCSALNAAARTPSAQTRDSSRDPVITPSCFADSKFHCYLLRFFRIGLAESGAGGHVESITCRMGFCNPDGQLGKTFPLMHLTKISIVSSTHGDDGGRVPQVAATCGRVRLDVQPVLVIAACNAATTLAKLLKAGMLSSPIDQFTAETGVDLETSEQIETVTKRNITLGLPCIHIDLHLSGRTHCALLVSGLRCESPPSMPLSLTCTSLTGLLHGCPIPLVSLSQITITKVFDAINRPMLAVAVDFAKCHLKPEDRTCAFFADVIATANVASKFVDSIEVDSEARVPSRAPAYRCLRLALTHIDLTVDEFDPEIIQVRNMFTEVDTVRPEPSFEAVWTKDQYPLLHIVANSACVDLDMKFGRSSFGELAAKVETLDECPTTRYLQPSQEIKHEARTCSCFNILQRGPTLVGAGLSATIQAIQVRARGLDPISAELLKVDGDIIRMVYARTAEQNEEVLAYPASGGSGERAFSIAYRSIPTAWKLFYGLRINADAVELSVGPYSVTALNAVSDMLSLLLPKAPGVLSQIWWDKLRSYYHGAVNLTTRSLITNLWVPVPIVVDPMLQQLPFQVRDMRTQVGLRVVAEQCEVGMDKNKAIRIAAERLACVHAAGGQSSTVGDYGCEVALGRSDILINLTWSVGDNVHPDMHYFPVVPGLISSDSESYTPQSQIAALSAKEVLVKFDLRVSAAAVHALRVTTDLRYIQSVFQTMRSISERIPPTASASPSTVSMLDVFKMRCLKISTCGLPASLCARGTGYHRGLILHTNQLSFCWKRFPEVSTLLIIDQGQLRFYDSKDTPSPIATFQGLFHAGGSAVSFTSHIRRAVHPMACADTILLDLGNLAQQKRSGRAVTETAVLYDAEEGMDPDEARAVGALDVIGLTLMWTIQVRDEIIRLTNHIMSVVQDVKTREMHVTPRDGFHSRITYLLSVCLQEALARRGLDQPGASIHRALTKSKMLECLVAVQARLKAHPTYVPTAGSQGDETQLDIPSEENLRVTMKIYFDRPTAIIWDSMTGHCAAIGAGGVSFLYANNPDFASLRFRLSTSGDTDQLNDIPTLVRRYRLHLHDLWIQACLETCDDPQDLLKDYSVPIAQQLTVGGVGKVAERAVQAILLHESASWVSSQFAQKPSVTGKNMSSADGERKLDYEEVSENDIVLPTWNVSINKHAMASLLYVLRHVLCAPIGAAVLQQVFEEALWWPVSQDVIRLLRPERDDIQLATLEPTALLLLDVFSGTIKPVAYQQVQHTRPLPVRLIRDMSDVPPASTHDAVRRPAAASPPSTPVPASSTPVSAGRISSTSTPRSLQALVEAVMPNMLSAHSSPDMFTLQPEHHSIHGSSISFVANPHSASASISYDLLGVTSAANDSLSNVSAAYDVLGELRNGKFEELLAAQIAADGRMSCHGTTAVNTVSQTSSQHRDDSWAVHLENAATDVKGAGCKEGSEGHRVFRPPATSDLPAGFIDDTPLWRLHSHTCMGVSYKKCTTIVDARRHRQILNIGIRDAVVFCVDADTADKLKLAGAAFQASFEFDPEGEYLYQFDVGSLYADMHVAVAPQNEHVIQVVRSSIIDRDVAPSDRMLHIEVRSTGVTRPFSSSASTKSHAATQANETAITEAGSVTGDGGAGSRGGSKDVIVNVIEHMELGLFPGAKYVVHLNLFPELTAFLSKFIEDGTDIEAEDGGVLLSPNPEAVGSRRRGSSEKDLQPAKPSAVNEIHYEIQYFRHIRIGELSTALTVSGMWGLHFRDVTVRLPPYVQHNKAFTWRMLYQSIRRSTRHSIFKQFPRLLSMVVGQAAGSKLSKAKHIVKSRNSGTATPRSHQLGQNAPLTPTNGRYFTWSLSLQRMLNEPHEDTEISNFAASSGSATPSCRRLPRRASSTGTPRALVVQPPLLATEIPSASSTSATVETPMTTSIDVPAECSAFSAAKRGATVLGIGATAASSERQRMSVISRVAQRLKKKLRKLSSRPASENEVAVASPPSRMLHSPALSGDADALLSPPQRGAGAPPKPHRRNPSAFIVQKPTATPKPRRIVQLTVDTKH